MVAQTKYVSILALTMSMGALATLPRQVHYGDKQKRIEYLLENEKDLVRMSLAHWEQSMKVLAGFDNDIDDVSRLILDYAGTAKLFAGWVTLAEYKDSIKYYDQLCTHKNQHEDWSMTQQKAEKAGDALLKWYEDCGYKKPHQLQQFQAGLARCYKLVNEIEQKECLITNVALYDICVRENYNITTIEREIELKENNLNFELRRLLKLDAVVGPSKKLRAAILPIEKVPKNEKKMLNVIKWNRDANELSKQKQKCEIFIKWFKEQIDFFKKITEGNNQPNGELIPLIEEEIKISDLDKKLMAWNRRKKEIDELIKQEAEKKKQIEKEAEEDLQKVLGDKPQDKMIKKYSRMHQCDRDNYIRMIEHQERKRKAHSHDKRFRRDIERCQNDPVEEDYLTLVEEEQPSSSPD